MWLIVIGERRQEISPTVAIKSFRQRFDIEHLFRFGKQRLLMTQFQTPDLQHEENWIRLVMLSYVQLWAAKDLATYLPRPWERPHDTTNPPTVTPSVVQRDFHRIISQIGKPGHSSKTRGNSSGRVAGHKPCNKIPAFLQRISVCADESTNKGWYFIFKDLPWSHSTKTPRTSRGKKTVKIYTDETKSCVNFFRL